MKNIIASFLMLFAFVVANASSNEGNFKVKAFDDDLVVYQIEAKSSKELGEMIQQVCEKFPQVERIEVELDSGEKITIRVVGKSMKLKKVNVLI